MKQGLRWIGWVAIAGLPSTPFADRAAAASPPLWHELTPGKYAVGFRSVWQKDYSRTYDTAFGDGTAYAPGKAPRPVLVNVWYPADRAAGAAPMPHGDYLKIASADPLLGKFSAALADYNRGVIAKEVVGKPAGEFGDRERLRLNRFLDAPTACVRDAEPARGPFPVVLYHAGAGSSFEDNSVLCEYLASHGFAVLGSAFQDRTGKSLNTDNREGSFRDLDFLIAYARTLPLADWNRIGLIGHSAGAQAALVYRSQPNSPVDAVVSLDTTQDYRGVKDPLWTFTDQVLRNGSDFTARC